MKNNWIIRLCCALLALAFGLTGTLSAQAAGPDYTMAYKLYRQLGAGSGFSGTLEISLARNEAAQGDALVTKQPLLIDWDYIYVTPAVNRQAEHRLDAALMNGEEAVSEAHAQLQKGVLSLNSPLLGDGWYAVELKRLLQEPEDPSTLAGQLLPGVTAAVEGSGMPALLQLLLPQVLGFQGFQDQAQRDAMEALIEKMTLRMDLWIEGYRQDAVLGKLEDGSAIIEVSYAVSPANVKAQAKQLVLDLLSDDNALSSLQSCLGEETAALLLNPAYQPYYFAAIDELPLNDDLTLSRTVDMHGETVALHLSLPLYDAVGGAVTLRYDRERGAGDLPDNNTLTLEGGGRSATLSFLTYRSMTDVTVYQGTFKATDMSNESFAVKPDGEAKPLPEIAFTLSRQTATTKEDGDLNVYTDNWQLTLEPDPNGSDPKAFLPLNIKLDSRFASKTPQTAATTADITLTVSGEERPQTVTLHFLGESRRQWQVEELPAGRTDLLALDGEGLESLLASLLTEGGKAVGFFLENTEAEAGSGAEETAGAVDPAAETEATGEADPEATENGAAGEADPASAAEPETAEAAEP